MKTPLSGGRGCAESPVFTAGTQPIWSTQITSLWTQKGWIYLAVVINFYSRRGVGWAMDR